MLTKHFAPVGRARQGAGQSASHLYPWTCSSAGQSRFRISAGQVQPEERRTGPGQRGMKGCLRSAGARKNALDFCKGRMLGKHDAFKVVLDPAT